MDRNPTIIKLGSTMPSLAARHGAFEDWIISGMGLAREAVWGVQFHPEFDAEVMQAHIRVLSSTVAAEGQDPGCLVAACENVSDGPMILSRFAGIVRAQTQGMPQIVRGATSS